MAKFNEIIVTQVGKSIYAKSIAGKTIEFTKVVVGNGKPASQEEAETLENVVDEKLIAAIEIDSTSKEGIAIVNVTIDNAKLADDVEICELGLFCKDPDTEEEVMYAYTYAPNGHDVIPSANSGEMIWKVQLFVYISNAAGNNASQSEVVAFTPIVKATSASGSPTFISNVVASGKSVYDGGLLTVFYKITGTLTNMDKAESDLSSLTISLPQTSAIECAVAARMVVTNSDNEQILVDVTGVIANGGSTIDLDYFGAQNGTFSLLATVHYII